MLRALRTSLTGNLVRKYSSVPGAHYDIIIAGGGMVGTALACTLGKNKKLSSKRILLLEGGKEKPYTLTETYSNRVVALIPNSYELFKKINVWPHIVNARFGTIKKMQVWDALSDAMITFNHENLSEVVAYVVENDLLVDSLLKETKPLTNVTIVNEAKIKSYELMKRDGFENVVHLTDGTKYTCSLLLGCDGAKSKVRDTMGVQYLSWDYDQMGIVATLKLSEAANNFVAWQRFLPTGPVALLPLGENLSSLIWSTTTQESKRLLALPEVEFVNMLNDAIWKVHRAENVVVEATRMFDNFIKSMNFPSNGSRQLPPSVNEIVPGSRAAFPLGFGHATNYVGDGVALVGDAAHRIHPLAGLGVNLGFGDVETLNQILGDSIFAGSKLGDIVYLKQYERERQIHNVPAMLVVDGLHRIYKTDFTPLVLLRSLGLQFTHTMDPLKKFILSKASV